MRLRGRQRWPRPRAELLLLLLLLLTSFELQPLLVAVALDRPASFCAVLRLGDAVRCVSERHASRRSCGLDGRSVLQQAVHISASNAMCMPAVTRWRSGERANLKIG